MTPEQANMVARNITQAIGEMIVAHGNGVKIGLGKMTSDEFVDGIKQAYATSVAIIEAALREVGK